MNLHAKFVKVVSKSLFTAITRAYARPFLLVLFHQCANTHVHTLSLILSLSLSISFSFTLSFLVSALVSVSVTFFRYPTRPVRLALSLDTPFNFTPSTFIHDISQFPSNTLHLFYLIPTLLFNFPRSHAANAFKMGKDLDASKAAYMRAVNAHRQLKNMYHAAKSTEAASAIAKDQKKM